MRGLAHLGAGEQEGALADYPSLYRKGAGGLVRLRIEAGALDLSELVRAGAGLAREPDWTALEPLALPGEPA